MKWFKLKGKLDKFVSCPCGKAIPKFKNTIEENGKIKVVNESAEQICSDSESSTAQSSMIPTDKFVACDWKNDKGWNKKSKWDCFSKWR